jgi:caffeoyl-CoA O-methyltransferase
LGRLDLTWKGKSSCVFTYDPGIQKLSGNQPPEPNTEPPQYHRAMPDVIDPQLTQYLDSLVPARPPELLEMERYAAEHDFPIVGPACAHICYQVTRMIGARRVFELGSGYGYSTAFFARGVKENGGGDVHHVVWDEDLSQRARKHLAALEVDDVVRYHVAEAVATLKQASGPFDLIFCDITKKDYPAALPVIEDKLRSGGVLIADNMLWSRRVLDSADASADTEGVREMTRLLLQPRWISSLVPIRDGLLIALKR